MKFGVALPANGPHASARFLRVIAERCESLGYHGLWISDHVSWSARHAVERFPAWAGEQEVDELQPNQYEPIATLAYLAGRTTTIRLGTAVVVLPVRNPVILAREIATLDDLSGGRISLGVGVGGAAHAESDFAAVGLRSLKSRRGRATDEWIEVMRRVWTERSCTYRGDLIEVDDAWIFPKPAQQSGPPILVGGDSEPALDRVARLADGSIVSRLTPDQVPERRGDLAARAERYGRTNAHFHLVVSQWLTIDDDESTAVARAERALRGVRRGGKPISGGHDNLIGSPGRVQATVAAYEESGVDELMLQVIGDSESEVLENLARFSSDVIRAVPHASVPGAAATRAEDTA